MLLQRLDRYILKMATIAAIVLLIGLTSVIWVTQALREVDLITGKGQTVVIFFTVTLLSLPALIAGIAPVALFMATLYTLNRLNSDSELIVMNAAGVAPHRITRPFIVLTIATSLLVGWMTLSVMPSGFRMLRDLITLIRADFVANVVKEGQFVALDSGVTFHYRERSGDALVGIFMQDRRDPNQPSIYIAERGRTVDVDGNSFLMLEKGTIQRETKNTDTSSIISFERYALNLSALSGDPTGGAGEGDGDKAVYKPRERTTWQLLNQDQNEAYYKFQSGRFRAELHNRLSAPLYPLAFMLIAFACIGEARTTRQGRAFAIQSAILIVAATRIGAYMAWTASVRSPLAAVLLYVLPVAAIILATSVILYGQTLRPLLSRATAPLMVPLAGLTARFQARLMLLFTTFGRYLTLQFARSILGVFGTFFFLIGTLDFVELMRRAGDSPAATTPLIVQLALFRVPSVAEQIFPFAVLFGGMFALLTLSRKLELVVARSVGVSAWQFLQPAAVVAGVVGLVSILVYNPVAADLKRKATALETRLFVRGAQTTNAPEIWLRQRSIDGQAIIRAAGSLPDGNGLAQVAIFSFSGGGGFSERVDARQAVLHPGYWELTDARVVSAMEEPQSYKTYLFATTLEPEQMRQSFTPPEAVGFWSMPAVIERTQRAGLDTTRYELRYQSLLARPLLLIAMVLVAASVSLRFFRFGGVTKLVIAGVAAGFVLYVATQLSEELGSSGIVNPVVAAWLPATIGAMLGALALLHQEDG